MKELEKLKKQVKKELRISKDEFYYFKEYFNHYETAGNYDMGYIFIDEICYEYNPRFFGDGGEDDYEIIDFNKLEKDDYIDIQVYDEDDYETNDFIKYAIKLNYEVI